jgi:hypothetical protein
MPSSVAVELPYNFPWNQGEAVVETEMVQFYRGLHTQELDVCKTTFISLYVTRFIVI